MPTRYVKVRGGAAVQYPITESDLSNATGLTYPNGATAKDFLNYGCYPVYPVSPDTSQDLVEELLPVKAGDGKWYEVWDARPFTPEELAQYKEDKQEVLREYRVVHETTMNPDYDTSREARVLLNESMVKAKTDPSGTYTVPTKSGFITGDGSAVLDLYDEIIDWVEACVLNEASLYNAIEAAVDKSAVDAIDIYSGWP